MRTFKVVASLVVSALAGTAAVADPILDHVTGGSGTGSYQSQSSAAGSTVCMDDFEINGTQGVGPQGAFAITRVESVFRVEGGAFGPQGFRVNIYTNDGNPLRENARTHVEGDRFSRIVQAGDPMLSVVPWPFPGESTNFPGTFLVRIDFGLSGPVLPLGSYFLSVVALEQNPSIQYFVSGSNSTEVGTPGDVFGVFNQGPGGQIVDFADNAAYRIIGVPGPGAAALLVLGGVMASRRRRV
ncbi:MAG: hypothetical protein JNK35_04570 [Phycisphaerae bacterium]|nr:hypothetical protein [Phycisphaerae bacterium]